MSDVNFKKLVVFILTIQLFFIIGVFHNINKIRFGNTDVYDTSDKSTCGDSNRKPCYVKVIR